MGEFFEVVSQLHESRRAMRIFLIAFPLTAVLLACASTQTGQQQAARSSRIITADEIAGTRAKHALEAIQLLRPQWLNVRGVTSATDLGAAAPVVYLNNTRYGDLESLPNIPAIGIQEIRFLNASDATTFFGINHMGGAFLIKMK